VRGSILLAAAVAALVVAGCDTSVTPALRDQPMTSARGRLGYSAAAFGRQRVLEERFRRSVSAERLASFHAAVTRQPHMAGTPGSEAVVAYLRKTLADAGFDVDVLEYRAYLSVPESIAVEITAPIAQSLSVTEPSSDLDPDTKHPGLGPGFVAYSADGDVTAPVVYVNYGLPADYAQLSARGVDVHRKLVIARYGRSHRAVKLHTAEQAGAAGILIYSDPADDGFVRGETWPNGFWRTEHQLQRGNGKYSWFWHGDPLTPGVAAVADAARLDPSTAPTLPHIPAAVLSWNEARKILEQLDGGAVPQGFQGGLPFSYGVGPGELRVRLRVRMDNALKPIRNVVARLTGARQPDRGVLLGTHHDAWTFGGVDPGTGTAALLELGRSLGELRRSGWQPQRTISLAFWDAEEFGLIGSTEYAEQQRRPLQTGTLCYINTDMYTNGRLDVGGVPSLRDLLIEVTKDIPEGTSSVYDAWRASEWSRQDPERRHSGSDSFEVELKSLGSGADFVPFQDHLGLPTLSVEFTGTGGYTYGAYHSNYDTRSFAARVADPGFVRGAQLVRLLGTTALRLGESQVLPFRFSHYADQLAQFVDRVSTSVETGGRRTVVVDVRPIQAAVERVAASASALERQIDNGLSSGGLPSSTTRRLNDVLARLEQRLLDETAPAKERWYRHLIYGWDIYSSYDGQPFPHLAQSVRSNDARRASQESARIAAALGRLDEGLREALRLTSAASR
jgi:N-acetylated-alpha-linked acidic dipeptidase